MRDEYRLSGIARQNAVRPGNNQALPVLAIAMAR
jgi:hypothetical protein